MSFIWSRVQYLETSFFSPLKKKKGFCAPFLHIFFLLSQKGSRIQFLTFCICLFMFSSSFTITLSLSSFALDFILPFLCFKFNPKSNLQIQYNPLPLQCNSIILMSSKLKLSPSTLWLLLYIFKTTTIYVPLIISITYIIISNPSIYSII